MKGNGYNTSNFSLHSDEWLEAMKGMEKIFSREGDLPQGPTSPWDWVHPRWLGGKWGKVRSWEN